MPKPGSGGIELEIQMKQNPVSVKTLEGSKKMLVTFDSRARGQSIRGHFGKFGKLHNRVFRSGGMGYYKYGGIGHISRDFSQGSSTIYFLCNQTGHKKVNFPRLTSGATREPTPTTLRITNGREGREEAPVVGSQAIQFQVEEVRASLDVVTGMYRIKFLFAFIILCL